MNLTGMALNLSRYDDAFFDHAFILIGGMQASRLHTEHQGTCCSGITSALHAEGLGLKSQCVQTAMGVFVKAMGLRLMSSALMHIFLSAHEN